MAASTDMRVHHLVDTCSVETMSQWKQCLSGNNVYRGTPLVYIVPCVSIHDIGPMVAVDLPYG